jgi:hypothetical protein
MRARMTIFCLTGLLLLLAAVPAVATVPNLLAWQGVALDSTDSPLADGSYMFSFSIWSAGDGGDSLWGESQVVNVMNGVLSILLGESVPIPDSVFSQPNRWLQVQFESEAPYDPRTRIVSVAYAMRVGTLDGASGGQVSTGINLKNAFTVPFFRTYREGTSTVIGELGGGGSGGLAALYRGTGETTVFMGPADPAGGRVTVFTNSSQTTGAEIGNTGNNNPYLLMLGATTYASLSMDSVGDPSVVLPPSSISSGEILDEPGIAAANNGTFYTLTGTMQDLATVTISIPAPGYIVVEGKCYGLIDGTTGLARGVIQIDETAGGGSIDPYFTVYGFDASASTALHYYPVYVTRTYYKSSVGTFTFRMEGLSSSDPSATVRAAKAFVTATYYPKSYGSVATVASSQEAGDFADAVPIQSTGIDDHTTPSPAGYEVDLRELELQAARTQAAADAARLELLRARLNQVSERAVSGDRE